MNRSLLTLLVALATIVLGATDAFAAGDAAQGVKLLMKKGCVSCHSTDGSARSGPTLLGLYGSTRTVTTAGSIREVTVDDEYITRAVRDPDAEVVFGFRRGAMPRFELGDEDVASIARAIEQLGPSPSASATAASSAKSPRAMTFLALFSAAFVGIHLFLSSGPVRKRLIERLKPGPFSGVYSLLVLGAFVGMILSFRSAPYVEIWVPSRALRWVPVLAMPIAILFMVGGFSTRSVTSVGQGSYAEDANAGRGIFTITRHPALWGFTIWAVSHLATNGELRAIIVFVAFLTLAIAGMLHIDRRRAAALGEAWTKYGERTSVVPFGAILRGRTSLDFRGIGVLRLVGSAFAYVTVLHTHAMLIGASPMP
jgi:uncharacterized membrane protein/mono/diheme cytochrome c family protein